MFANTDQTKARFRVFLASFTLSVISYQTAIAAKHGIPLNQGSEIFLFRAFAKMFGSDVEAILLQLKTLRKYIS